jgi:RNA polymerase sigma-70 factor (ECF subfamily)
METLPPAQRRVVEQLYFEGLTNAELAKASGEPLGTIKTRARLAVRKMRALLLGVEELP